MEPQLGYWLFSLGLLAAPFVAVGLIARSDPDGPWRRWLARAAQAAVEPEDWADDQVAAELAAEMAAVLRRERLVRDLQRVQHLIATDAWMSAVRQIGNRMAYEQLLHDLRVLPEPVFPAVAAGGSPGWGGAAPSRRAAVGVRSVSGSGTSAETIDFRLWR